MKGIIITFHFVWVSLFYRKNRRKGEYHFSGLIFKYDIPLSLIELFADIFTLNPYFFISKGLEPVIIDIGGNIGDSLLYFKYLYKNSKLYVFEPHPEAFKLLQENIKANKFTDVKTYQEAVSDTKGELKIYSENKGDSRKSSSDRIFLAKVIDNSLDIVAYTSKLVKISNNKEIKKLKVIDLLKIDAEGHESKIISDLSSHGILNKVQKVIIEYHFMTKLSDNSLDNIIEKLRSSGFKLSFFNYYRYLSNVTDTVAFMICADK